MRTLITCLFLCLVLTGEPTALAGDNGASPVDTRMRALPPPLVWLSTIDPSIRQDMRYATENNFTSAPVPGYLAGACILTRATAEALATVQSDLAAQGLSLMVYDCYRPRRAVAAFVEWVREGEREVGTRQYYPRTSRSRLIRDGYIAAESGHSRGNAVDLTLTEAGGAAQSHDEKPMRGSCIDSAAGRTSDASVDMGTAFDCFDTKSRTASREVGPRQRQWRQTLLAAMSRRGFANYPKEWWHFSYPQGDPGRSFDVLVSEPPKPTPPPTPTPPANLLR